MLPRTLLHLAALLGPACILEAGTNLVLSPPTNNTNLVYTNAINLGGSTLTVNVPTKTATMTGVLSNSTGTGDLLKTGSGTLVLAAPNTYNGVTTVSQGVLRVGQTNALGTIASGTTVAEGATLDLNAIGIGGETVTISGTGAGGNGALVNLGTASATGLRLGLSANASVGGTARIDTSFGGTVINAGTNTLTKVGTNSFVINAGTTSMGPLLVNRGAVVVVNGGTALGDTNFGTLVASNASLQFFNSSGSAMSNRENITLAGGAELASTLATKPNILDGSISLSPGTATVRVDSRGKGTLVLGGTVTGAGHLNKTGAGTLELRGANTRTGDTVVADGAIHLVAGGSLRFLIGGNGTNNTLGGAGITSIDGQFDFDLVGASTRVGDSWTILSGSLSNTYGTNFLVRGFYGNGGRWTKTTNGVSYVFTQSNRVLRVSQALVTSDYANWVGLWQGSVPGFSITAGNANPDGDTLNNDAEFAFGGNPTSGDSSLLTATRNPDNLVFCFIARNSPPGDVSYLVQTTTNLGNGPWTTAAVTISNSRNQEGIPLPADYHRKEFAVPATNTAFYRVRAVAASPDPPPVEDMTWLPTFIATQVAAGEKRIVIPPGRYRVQPSNRQHLLLRGLKDTEIVADQVELVCTETTRAITIEDCENVTIRGLTIDYDPLPFTQGRITSISADAARLEVDILEGYPEPGTSTGSVEIFDPATGSLRGRVTYYKTLCEPNGPMRAVLTKSSPSRVSANEQIGDIAVIKASYAPGGSMPHTIYATRSKGLVMERITLHASNSFGFLENGCEGSRYINCRVARRDPTDDLRRREHRRLRSLNADAFHSKNARQGPIYDGCSAFYMGDDAIAINGDFHYITRVEGAALRVLAKSSMPLQPGDDVQFFTKDGRRPGNRRVVSVVPDGPITPGERAMLLEQKFNGDLGQTAMEDGFLVTLDAAAGDIVPGTLICDAGAIGDGFIIRNCRLGQNRSRGLMIKAGKGEITGNHIEGARMTAISIAPEYWWLEAGLSDDLVIADNLITEGGGMGISVLAAGGDGTISPAGAFNNITLRNNRIEGGASPSLLLTSIRGLTEDNNVVSPDPDKSLHSWEIGSWGANGVQAVMKLNIVPEVAP